MEYVTDEANTCGVAISLKVGALARAQGVTVEVPVEEIQALAHEELGAHAAGQTVVVVDKIPGRAGQYSSMTTRLEKRKWLPEVSHDQVIRIGVKKQNVRGAALNIGATLRHEFTHANDIGPDPKRGNRRYRMFSFGVSQAVAQPLVLGETLLVSAYPAERYQALGCVDIGLMFGLILFLGNAAGYMVNPYERRARKHEEATKFSTKPIMVYASDSTVE